MLLDELIDLFKKLTKSRIICEESSTKYHFSRESTVEEYGEEIWGAKKHILGLKRLKESLESIEEKGDDYAIENIIKKNLVPDFDIQEQIEKGKSAGHIFFSKYIIDSIPSKPSIPESPSYRESYYNEVKYILSLIDETNYLNDLVFRIRERARTTEKQVRFEYEESKKKDNSTYHHTYHQYRIHQRIYKMSRYYVELDHMGGRYRNALTLGIRIPDTKRNPVLDRLSQARRLESGEQIKEELDPELILIDYRDEKLTDNGFLILRNSTEQDYSNLIKILSPKKIITSEKTIADSINERNRLLLAKYGNLQEKRFPYLSESGEIAVNRLGDDFGFRGIQFGNYVSDKDRIIHTKLVYGSFYDLSQVIGMELNNIGLNKQLSISIGSRGSGRAKAHYEKNQKIINLTKTRGNGSIAHEYGHALDHILYSALREYDGDINQTLSKRFTQYHREYKRISSDNERLEYISDKDVAHFISYQYNFTNLDEEDSRHILETIYFILAYIRESGFRSRSLKEGIYWGNNEELFARAFESYISDKLEENNIENYYLVFSTKGKPIEREFSIYPQNTEREELNKIFDDLFVLMKPIWNKLFIE